jgi:hypothetical protein
LICEDYNCSWVFWQAHTCLGLPTLFSCCQHATPTPLWNNVISPMGKNSCLNSWIWYPSSGWLGDICGRIKMVWCCWVPCQKSWKLHSLCFNISVPLKVFGA